MSAAVMSTSTLYEFGDILYKNHNNNNNTRTSTTNQNNINNLQQTQHQKVLRWEVETSHRAVGSPVVGASSSTSTTFQHQTISRRNSNPVTTDRERINVTASLVSTLILDNIREQQQQQQQPVHRKLDRSQSEPAPSALVTAANAKAANINTSRYKTELCRPFEESGSCKYGDKCQFAHGAHELRNLVRHPKYKTELCRTFHTIGFCPYGPRCHFIHNADEARTKVPGTQPLSASVTTAAVTTSPTSSGISNRPKPLNLGSSPFMVTGSTADSPSPTSSLSQSPTTSVGSFFSPEQDVFATVAVMSASSPPPSATSANTAFSFGQDFTPLVHLGGVKQQSPSPASPPASSSPVGSLSPRGSPPPGTPDARLPVFNRLSSTMLDLGGLAELLA
ncbi:protein TIS11 [Periplaneta americana]